MRLKIRFLILLFFGVGLLSNISNAQSDFVLQIGNKKISSSLFEKDYRRLLESDSIKSGNKQKFLSDYIDYQCNPINETYVQFTVRINDTVYPMHVSPHLNKSINFECLNRAEKHKIILFWNKLLYKLIGCLTYSQIS
jgi:hypothetical protein